MTITIDWLLYLLPLFPCLVAAVLLVCHWPQKGLVLDSTGKQRDSQRSQIVGLAGFAFAGMLALAVVDATLRKALDLPIYYLLVSFLFYMSSLNSTRYWFYKAWHLLLTSTLMDIGSLCLLLSVSDIVRTYHPGNYGNSLTTLAVTIWAIDFGMNLATWRKDVIEKANQSHAAQRLDSEGDQPNGRTVPPATAE